MSTVLITGANKGVGLELARIYADRGDTVLACCREPGAAAALNELAAAKPAVSVHGVVVGDGGSVSALGKTLVGKPIDILINNAGMAGPPPQAQNADNMDFDGWMETMNVNTMAPLRVLQALRANLQAGSNAKVVTITSQMGALSLDMAVMYAYCASKAAVNKVMRLASHDLRKDNIAVGLIHPGWVRTDMGGPQADLAPEESARGIVAVIDDLSMETTGCFMKWNGEAHGW